MERRQILMRIYSSKQVSRLVQEED